MKSGIGLDIEDLRRQGYQGDEVLGIQVTNHGRAPLTVDRVSVHPRGEVMSLVPVGTARRDPASHIQPGANASWYMPIAQARGLAEVSRSTGEPVTGLYMSAELGTGRTVATPTTLTA